MPGASAGTEATSVPVAEKRRPEATRAETGTRGEATPVP